MSSYKKLSTSDITQVPYYANKQWTFLYNSIPTTGSITILQGQNITGSFHKNEPTTSLGQYQRLIYTQTNQLYYQDYSASLNTGSLMQSLNYVSASSYRATSSYFNYNVDPAFQSNFPTASNSTIQIISISSTVFGSRILPTTFNMQISSSYQIYDDGHGNIFSGSSQIGNIFYSQGQIIVTSQNNQNILYPIEISFKNEHIIYEHEVKCLIRQNEYNLTYNPTALNSSSSLNDNVSGSGFYPYTTGIGLYNDANELLMIAKFGKPLMISPFSDTSIIVKYDT